jgi:hypothetical protein
MNDATTVETTHPLGFTLPPRIFDLDTEKAFHEHIGFLLLFCSLPSLLVGKCICFRLLSCTREHRFVSSLIFPFCYALRLRLSLQVFDFGKTTRSVTFV